MGFDYAQPAKKILITPQPAKKIFDYAQLAKSLDGALSNCLEHSRKEAEMHLVVNFAYLFKFVKTKMCHQLRNNARSQCSDSGIGAIASTQLT